MIAAVAGYALGGGCELAMMCDLIIAADTAKFGQPEITIGTMPGMGGTQRLPRAVGKAKAMDWCLTGRMIDAQEAERSGLVARVVPADKLFDEALAVAAKIAGYSLPVVLKIKEAINRAYESSLPKACCPSAASFTRPSRWTIRRKACARSSKSASPSSSTARVRVPTPCFDCAAAAPLARRSSCATRATNDCKHIGRSRRRPPTTPCPNPSRARR